MHITVLGGADSAEFISGLSHGLSESNRLSVVFNTARDMWAHGLKRSPDGDGLLRSLGDSGADSFSVADDMSALGMEPTWLRTSDQDIALQLVRTELMQAGYSLSDVTTALASRRGISVDLAPMSDDRVEQRVVVDGTEGPRAVHVEEFLRQAPGRRAKDVILVSDDWTASRKAVGLLETADIIVLAPSSFALTLTPIFKTPGIAEAIGASGAFVIDARGRDSAPPEFLAGTSRLELKFDDSVETDPSPEAVLDAAGRKR